MLKTINAKKVVVKIGTKVLTGKESVLDRARMKSLVDQISDIVSKNIKVVVVSSGAIGAGMKLLGFKERPKVLSKLQACAAVGQSHLMQIYNDLFKSHSLLAAQVLLTQEDLNERARYLNAKATLTTLLDEGVVPIINENDTISTDEIKFGDNDRLSSLVANLIEADLLILLSDVDGLYNSKNELVRTVGKISDEIESMAHKSKDELGTGGMVSKLQAAKMVTNSGITCIIENGKKDNILVDIISEADRKTGTLFLPSSDRMAARKCWLLFGAKPKGRIRVDNGAKEALIKKHKSLLASGIVSIDGDFKNNDIISIVDTEDKEFARGITNYPSKDIAKIKGKKTTEISKAIGYKGEDEVVHKDNLVILK